jgi:hypothetical protein
MLLASARMDGVTLLIDFTHPLLYSLYDCFVPFVLQYNLGLLDVRDVELPQYDISTAALEVHFITARFSNLGCVII